MLGLHVQVLWHLLDLVSIEFTLLIPRVSASERGFVGLVSIIALWWRLIILSLVIFIGFNFEVLSGILFGPFGSLTCISIWIKFKIGTYESLTTLSFLCSLGIFFQFTTRMSPKNVLLWDSNSCGCGIQRFVWTIIKIL